MSRGKLIVCGGLLSGGGLVCWLFPLFHVRPLGGEATEAKDPSAAPRASGTADPIACAREYWEGPLRTGDGGTEISRLWDAFDADASEARNRYGRQAGLGGAWYFRVRGRGTVESAEKNRCVLTVGDSRRRACLELGLVVDNTVREAIGVDVSEFANSRDYNVVSSELNRRVEQEVIAPNRPLLKPGAIVEFMGCAKIGSDSDLDPLCLIPIRIEVRGEEQDGLDVDDKSDGATCR